MIPRTTPVLELVSTSRPPSYGRGKPAADILPWPGGQANPPAGGARSGIKIVAEAYRDLEAATARLELIDRLAALIAETPKTLLPTVTLLCQGESRPTSPAWSSAWPSGWPPARSPRPRG